MSITPLRRGNQLRLGPEINEFSGADLSAAQIARDDYFIANPSNLAAYNNNSDLLIRLIYTDTDVTTKFQQRLGGSWVDITPVVQGPNGEVVSLAGVPIGEIPYKLIDGTFGGSNMRVLEDGSILAPPGFAVESGSITFGEALTLSEVSGYLGISNHVNGNLYTVMDFFTPPTAASSEPHIFYLTSGKSTFVAQGIDTVDIPDNPLIFNYTVQNTARSHSLTFRTYAAMDNVRAKISLVSSGVALKYFPNRKVWEEGFGGISWSIGDNVVEFEGSPLNLEAGMVLKFEIYADTVALKGNVSNIPYFTAENQPGVFINVITDNAYTASDIKSKLESLSSPNKLSKTAIQDAVLTVNGSFGAVSVTTGSIGAQPVDATLTALAGQVTAADGLTYSTGVDTFAQTTLTSFGRSLIDDSSASVARTTLGLVSNTYTPVLTSITNILSSSAYSCQYMQVGSVVTVSGKITIDPSSNGAVTRIGMSLPVASNFTNEEDCAGTSACWESQQSGIILADGTNNRAQMEFLATTSTIRDHFFTYTYRVI